MALMDCTECGHRVSDQATACPSCGMPLKPETDQVSTAAAHRIMKPPQVQSRSVGILLFLGIALLPMVFVWFLLRKGHSSLARLAGFTWLGLALMVGWSENQNTAHSGHKPTTQATSSTKAQGTQRNARDVPVIQVSAKQLALAYDRNAVAADQRYKGKRIKVTGVVDSINTSVFGRPYITLRGGVNRFMEPQFELNKNNINYAAGLSVDRRVTLICTGRGDVIKTPMSDNCAPAD